PRRRAESASLRRGVGPAAGHKTDADPAETDPRRLRGFVAGRALRAVHLLRGSADPEIAAWRVHRGLRADLDEPSARPGLGVSQALIRPAPSATGFCPDRDFKRWPH